MLIETQRQPQSTTPPTPQLSLSQSQSMVSSPSPHNSYDMIERFKLRVGGYRNHHSVTYQKNNKTIESQTMKMKSETQRLQQQFLNSGQNNTNNNKSKQQKSVNTTGGQRTTNKRTNSAANSSGNTDSKSDSTEQKPTKMAKVANNRTNNSVKASHLSPNNNCSKFNTNSQSNQMDVKMKPSIASSCISTTNSQIFIQNNAINSSAPEIKREIIDNSYFEGVTADAICDFLDAANTPNTANTANNTGFSFNGSDGFGSDLFNDTILTDDGFGGANFGDEDFIAKFLEDLNETNCNEMSGGFGQQMNLNQMKGQQVVNHSNHVINGNNNNDNNSNNGINCNINVNLMNGNPNNNNMNTNANQMNSIQFTSNQLQTTANEMTSYTPIQPRLQPNMMSNIPNRSSIQMIATNNGNFAPIAVTNTNVRNYTNVVSVCPQPQQQQLLLQQMTTVLPQQTLNSGQQQTQPPQLVLQQSQQPLHLRLTTASMPRMGIVSVAPKPETNISAQLSIQVPQQPNPQTQSQMQTQSQQNTHSSQAAANASIKLKQMALQHKTHHWVLNHANAPLAQNSMQTMPQQSQQMIQTSQRLTQQTPPQQQRPTTTQVLSPEPQNQIQIQSQPQTQTYFAPQMSQQIYWQQQQQQTQSQPQSQQIPQQNMQNQQNFSNYWSHPSQMGSIVGQPSQQQQPQQQQPQQSQHYYNNTNNNNNNYNYF